jgi:hypothetical protein
MRYISCEYFNNNGHNINECYKKMFNNRQNNINNDDNNVREHIHFNLL